MPTIASPETLGINGHRVELDSAEPKPAARLNGYHAKDIEETLYLTGRPSLKQFVRFIRGQAVNPPDAGELNDEWQAAARQIAELQETEAGLADNPAMTSLIDLGGVYEPLLIELLKSHLVKYHFNTVPTDIAMVELD